MELTGLDLGAWLTESGAVVLLYEYDEVTQVFLGYVVHPMREVRYGKDGRLVSCCFLAGESQTVEHEQKLHAGLHLDKKLDLENDAICVANIVEWMERSSKAVLAPARRQDSAGAGIYDEQPPLVNTYADRTLNASRLLQDAVDDPLSRFNVPEPPAEIEVVRPPLREWRVLTPGGCWETLKADEVMTCNTSVDMYRDGEQVGFFVNPQAVIAGCEVDVKPAIPIVTIEQLTPLGDALGVLRRVAKSNTCSVAVEQAVIACTERFNNLVKFSK